MVHPNRPIIGYYLLWRDDVHGAWIPFTKATDEEIVWVGYDSTKAPTDVWTYWHGKILHADWRDRGPVAIDVQWGKHGSMPRGIVDDADMWPRTLTNFWVSSWIGLPDIWLGRLSRPGPLCFCHGYRRYRTFDRPIIAGERIDVVVRTEDPDDGAQRGVRPTVLEEERRGRERVDLARVTRRRRYRPRRRCPSPVGDRTPRRP